ncbi:MAG: Bifunctional purine biosynthesis protein PurH [bacterium ADurb.Bin236]|mgnify:CR=1 FL=1|nr:MAG: Bifunctional purine biosynthesis protein PurH [bacterium ADurb.Bin236]
MLKIKTAVLSVSDKTGVVEFAKFLSANGVKIISTGGTAKALKEAGVKVVPISKITGNKKDDYFDGRMKTISFNYESALLYKRDNPTHVKQAAELGIPKIDMVVCNLYPFEKVTAAKDCTVDKAVENIDIGGPCMVRAAAKNFEGVAIVVDPASYGSIMAEMKANNGGVTLDTRAKLASKAFERTADYDAAINTFFSAKLEDKMVKRLKYTDGFQLGRYAENWHQKGWLYREEGVEWPNLPNCKQVFGGALGYNNYLDGEAAMTTALEFKKVPAVSIIKHCNPCGLATGATIEEAFERAWAGDPVSAFGSVICLTRNMTLGIAKLIEDRFVEIIIAPKIEKKALDYIESLGKKKAGLRLLEFGDIKFASAPKSKLRAVSGGMLEQETDDVYYLCKKPADLMKKASEYKCKNSGKKLMVGVVSKKQPPAGAGDMLDFGLRHVKNVKSNAISIIREYSKGKYQVIGMGCGQPNRKDSVLLCALRATGNLQREFAASQGAKVDRDEFVASLSKNKRAEYLKKESAYIAKQLESGKIVLVSDAFFPFRDGLDNAATTGVKFIVEPGGSVRDDSVIAAADEQGIALVFTGVRKFNH